MVRSEEAIEAEFFSGAGKSLPSWPREAFLALDHDRDFHYTFPSSSQCVDFVSLDGTGREPGRPMGWPW